MKIELNHKNWKKKVFMWLPLWFQVGLMIQRMVILRVRINISVSNNLVITYPMQSVCVIWYIHCCTLSLCYLGAEKNVDNHHRDPSNNTEKLSSWATKGSLSPRIRMNFRKISERPLPPPPAPFSENFIAIFSANRLRRH